MKIGLIDVDGHKFPNLALMKISAFHKAAGDHVEWCFPLDTYDLVYQAKVFDETYTKDIDWMPQADKIIKGGTGYGLGGKLPEEIENIYPDYSIYPELTKNTAYGFLTRGCPRACGFCIVAEKEGRRSVKVADLDNFWRGQKNIKLLDPNILACRQHLDLLEQLAGSGAWVDFTQGLDIRLTNEKNIEALNRVKTKMLHFAWDNPEDDLKAYFERFNNLTEITDYRKKSVYILTNFNSTLEQDLYRIYTLRDLGFSPYVMIYNKPKAPREIRLLQRWCNNRIIFYRCPDFKNYDPSMG